MPDKHRSIIQIDTNKNRGLKEKQCSKNFKRMIFHKTKWASWQALHHSEPTRRSQSNHHHEDSKAENQTEICVFVSANQEPANQEKIWGISGTSRLSTDLATKNFFLHFKGKAEVSTLTLDTNFSSLAPNPQYGTSTVTHLYAHMTGEHVFCGHNPLIQGLLRDQLSSPLTIIPLSPLGTLSYHFSCWQHVASMMPKFNQHWSPHAARSLKRFKDYVVKN